MVRRSTSSIVLSCSNALCVRTPERIARQRKSFHLLWHDGAHFKILSRRMTDESIERFESMNRACKPYAGYRHNRHLRAFLVFAPVYPMD
jgi:hypothetical protein